MNPGCHSTEKIVREGEINLSFQSCLHSSAHELTKNDPSPLGHVGNEPK